MTFNRRARSIVAAAAIVLVASGIFSWQTATAAPALPAKMSAIGDSLTQAIMTCGSLSSCTSNSWAVGTNRSVASHAARLRGLGASLTTYNNAVTSAKSAALPAQASRAASQGSTYITMQIGANDVCTPTVGEMTSTATFRKNVSAALDTLAASPSKPDIFVASIPNIKRLWEVNKSNVSARLTWRSLGLCQSMLANPTSNAAADVQRRNTVQARVDAFNTELAQACAGTAKCRWDGGAVAKYTFARSEISSRDYFHPSVAGQAKLASLTWAASQWVR